MQIINPEMHKEYLKIKDSTDIQVGSYYGEDLENDDFAQIISAAESRYKPKPPTEETRAHDIAVPPTEATPPKVEQPKRNPLQWGRPPDLPPLVVGDSKPPEDEDPDVSFTWE